VCPVASGYVRVTFYKLTEKRVSTWEATRGKRTRVPGSTMALGRGGMPHDLLQMLVEGSVGIDRGFWGSVASGATFRSTGRKRTNEGRAVIARNRSTIDEAERIVGDHLSRWAAGADTPCSEVLGALDRRWRDLEDGEGLVIEWPSLEYLGVTPAVRSGS
jgi:hypothetical protein